MKKLQRKITDIFTIILMLLFLAIITLLPTVVVIYLVKWIIF